MINLNAFLTRIGCHESFPPTIETLARVQHAHLFSVPFENLDIHLGRTILLDEDSLFAKIVTRRRGGFCYELNGLLAIALEELGYHVERLNGRSAKDDGSYSADFDHLVLKVHAPNDPQSAWLVDVGWGDGPFDPLRLDDTGEQPSAGRLYRLRSEEGLIVLEEKLERGDWLKHYGFDLSPHTLPEFAGMCHYHQTSPDSFFTRKRLASLYQPYGRITLSELTLITTRGSGLRGSETREERQLSSEEEARHVLSREFGIELV